MALFVSKRVGPCAEEGDVRLADEFEVANWMVGNLEVFVGGAWRQVCAAGFDNNEADIACGQMGYGAGTSGPFFDVRADAGTSVFSDVGIILPGCNGTESNLLECGEGSRDRPFFANNQEMFGCRDDRGPGLTLACVTSQEDGSSLHNCIRTHCMQPGLAGFIHRRKHRSWDSWLPRQRHSNGVCVHRGA